MSFPLVQRVSLGAVLLLAAAYIPATVHASERWNFDAVVIRHEAKLRALAEESGRGVDQAPRAAKQVEQYLTDRDAEAARRLVETVGIASMGSELRPHVPARIGDDAVIDLLVASLQSPDANLRQLSLTYLWKYVSPDRLRGRVDGLVEAWGVTQDDLLLLLLGETGTTEAQDLLREIMPSRRDVPRKLRARVYGGAAAVDLIQSFYAETDPEAKGRLALELGYVASPAAISALAGEFRTPLVVETRYYSYSVRYRILMGLRRALPSERLFGQELTDVVRATQDLGSEQHAERVGNPYIDRVERWCEGRFEIEWDKPRPAFLLWRQNRVPRPLPR